MQIAITTNAIVITIVVLLGVVRSSCLLFIITSFCFQSFKYSTLFLLGGTTSVFFSCGNQCKKHAPAKRTYLKACSHFGANGAGFA